MASTTRNSTADQAPVETPAGELAAAATTSTIDTADLGRKEEKEEAEEGGQSQAFNPETGEINWDCPCLGGMAQGTCGEQFKAAFSCFIYSEEEPKGMDCVDAFKAMQDCFRAHPEEYANEINDDDEEEAEEDVESEGNATDIEDIESADDKGKTKD
ncbi:Oxidoreductase [Coemansia aciculifera]|uniref:Oxidoreductase n=1 Tax=Coemansia aciculifera TaxID=417176 RepID=A0ACC1M9R7_9FUNG|nr:Oxidoreductase [Coemansia aciculifera]